MPPPRTASSFDGLVTGSASSVTQGKNLNLGAVNAVSFVGDFTGNATGIITSSAIKVGSLTASSFVGDFTGTATSMAKGTGFKAGTVTATPANVTYTVTVGSKTGGGNAYYLDGTEAPTPSLYPGATYTFDQAAASNDGHPLRFATAADAAGSTEYTFQVTTNGTPGNSGAYTRIVVSPSAPDTLYYYCSSHSGMGGSINITNLLQGDVTGAVTGDVKGNIAGNVTGNVTGNAVGAAGSVLSGSNIHVGVMTATTLSGDGSALTGIAATNFNTQTVVADSAETIIALDAGNSITLSQSTNTTVGFASTSTSMNVTIVMSSGSSGTITWPSNVLWDEATPPTLIDGSVSGETQQFQFLTRDGGLTWYAWQDMKNEFSVKYALFTFGENESGQLGQNNEKYDGRYGYSSPTQVPGIWAHAIGGKDQARSWLISKPNGSLWSVGRNTYGTLGVNDRTARSSPIQIGTDKNWSILNLGAAGACLAATKTDGSLWVWGNNSIGQLGQNDKVQHSSPVQIPGTWQTSKQSISCAENNFAAIKADGTAWGWGYNAEGPLGHNNTIAYSSPMQIGTDTDWARVGGGANALNIFKSNGDAYVMGYNANGSLGQNNKTNYSSPIQLPGSWNMINSGGYGATMGIKADDSLWSWGYGVYGALGLNESGSPKYSSPVQIPGSWSYANTAMFQFALATKTDGTAWGWGRQSDSNSSGNLGQNSTTLYSSPKQIGSGTDWKYIWCSIGASYAFKEIS